MTRDEAVATFQRLIARYGLYWTASVPRAAYELLAECNKLMTETDRRMALGLRC